MIRKFMGYDHDTVPLSVAYPPSQIRFITCWENSNTELSFKALISSFDNYTWIMVVLTLFIVVPTFHLVTEKNTPIQFILTFIQSSLKLLLEQSNPYPQNMLSNFHLKILSTSTMLTVLVISNAYKNDNIYDLVLPPKFIPFEYFDELILANFTILSEPNYVLECDSTICYSRFKGTHKRINSRHKFMSDFKNKVAAFVAATQVGKQVNEFRNHKMEPPKKLHKIYNSSEMILSSLQRINDSIPFGKTFSRYLSLPFNSDQVQVSMNLLSKCNKTAILASETRIWKYETHLKLLGISKLSIGREALLAERIGFQPFGWLPDFIRKRIRGMENSGILDWWNHFVSVHLVRIRAVSRKYKDVYETQTQVSKRENFRGKTEMTGNIRVIFFALMIGNFVAFCIILFELVWVKCVALF